MMRRTVLAAMLLALLALAPAQTYGQDEPPPATMPSGWQQLDAEAFAATCEELFKAKPGPTADHVKEVVAHAWSEFLNDEDFVNTGAWADVHAVTAQFAHRRNVLVTGTTPEEKEASTKAVNEQFTTLKTRLAARIEANPTIVNDNAFNELLTLNTTLNRAGFSHAERVAMFAQWMDNNEWKELNLDQQSVLFETLNVDRINRADMAARWTGTITAPASGDYTFRQLRSYVDDSALKVWINGKLVLDSTLPELEEGQNPPKWDEISDLYASQPVALTANQATSIKVELRHKSSNVARLRGYPMAVLMWESAQMAQSIVPSSALRPPQGFGTGNGLKGEYFKGDFEEAMLTRQDAALNFIWNNRPVVNLYQAKRDQLLERAWPSLIGEAQISALDDKGRAALINAIVPRYAADMGAFQRSELIRTLAGYPALLETVSPWSLGELLISFYMLPNDERVDFIGAWAEARPQPQLEFGIFPGWGNNRYRSLNHDPYWVLGRQLVKGFYADAEKLQDRYFRRSDGNCNLAIAYMVAFAAKIDNLGPSVKKHLDQVLADENLSADQRVTWLLARAYVQEVANWEMPKPDLGIAYTEEAFAQAESDPVRFWALRELMVRLISMNQTEYALSILDSVQDQFPGDAEQAEFTKWREHAEAFSTHYESTRVNQERAAEIKRLRDDIAFLKRRKDEYEQSQRPAQDIAAMNRLILEAEQQLAEVVKD